MWSFESFFYLKQSKPKGRLLYQINIKDKNSVDPIKNRKENYRKSV